MKEERRRLSGYREIWVFLIKAYGERCVYCHKNISTQIDHVIPYSYCRYHGIENLRPACACCNLIASDKVFETFEAKYEYIKKERAKGKGTYSLLVCSNCLLPFYSALGRSAFYCPRCNAREYEMPPPKSKAWRSWLDTLTKAGISYRAHFYLADKLESWGVFNIPTKDKVEHIVQYMMRHAENIDVDTMLEVSEEDMQRDLTFLLT